MIRAFCAGALLALAAPPWNLWFAAPIGLAILLTSVESRDLLPRIRNGFVCGLTLFVVTLSWSRQFHVLGWLALSAFEALFLAAAMAFVPNKARTTAIAFVTSLTLSELARTHWPWGGLPMGSYTTGQASSPFAEAAAIAGEPAFVPLLATLAVILRFAARRTFWKQKRAMAVAAVALAGIVALPVAGSAVTSKTSGTLKVAAVQGGGEQALLREEQRPDAVFAAHVAATQNVPAGTQLIVWPEDVVQVDAPEAAEYTVLRDVARTHQASLIAGVVQSMDGDRFRNLAISWDANGNVTGEYEKYQRVPFGEFVPGRRWLDKVADLSQVPSDAFIGKGPATLPVTAHTKAGVAVSYEGLFSRRARAATRDGGELLVIPTNASSYESESVSRTQLQAARLRSIETGRWVVQAAPTGISAIVDNNGSVRVQSKVGPPAVLTADALLSRSITPYVRFGDIPLFAISAVLLFAARLRTKKAGEG